MKALFPANLLLALLLVGGCADSGGPSREDLSRWQGRADAVTIVRDDWGVPHIYAGTDADVVFGLMYAQAEDDFNRIETNFLTSLGRLAEAEGEKALYSDLRMKLFIDPEDLKAKFAESPEWLKALMEAWADGLNYFLYSNPDVNPRVITQFEPWMALSFSEGSIGGDIESISLAGIEKFYAGMPDTSLTALSPGRSAEVLAAADFDPYLEPTGSNGFAIAPEKSASGDALLWINPHTSFFFRAEVHLVSDEGLNTYGAVTWGQFFVYQGFNESVGWMHTSSGVDNIDEYAEQVVERDNGLFYRYGNEERPVWQKSVTVPYRTPEGLAERTFTVFRTHHGPIVRSEDSTWIAVRLMDDPVNALTQSYSRTKARNMAEYLEAMELHTNSSNNTVYADADGNIAYFHSNFIPRRDPRFDWSRPVDGSDPATEWDGVLSFEESPNVINPPNGWIQNTNNWPYSASGPYSPKRTEYAQYVDEAGENPRGINAVRVLGSRDRFTMDTLTEAAFDPYLSWFADVVPPLVRAWDRLPVSDERRESLASPIERLRGWDFEWAVESVETTLAIHFAEAAAGRLGRVAREAGLTEQEFANSPAAAEILIEALGAGLERLVDDFGTWEKPWGEINRFQRLTGDIVQPFDDDGPSIPVGFTSSRWGSLASFAARPYDGTKKRYGTSGNSFVAVVEFGDSLRARAVTAGGLHSDPQNPHFNDQAERYAAGRLRDVYFYRSQLEGHTERTYHPGR